MILGRALVLTVVECAIVASCSSGGLPASRASQVATATANQASASQQPTSEQPSATATIAASSAPTYPPGGISASSAKAIATSHTSPTATLFLSLRAGTFGHLAVFIGSRVDAPVPSTTWVWAVKFYGTATPCGALTNVCESPRPGTITVVLDYYTGRFIVSYGDFPNPD